MIILEVSHLSKFFGGLKATSDISFSVERGMIMGLIGPNGAGKTTLFNCITGYYPPTEGDVIFNGISIAGRTPNRICHLGMVRTWQKVRPLTKLTVLQNVIIGALCRTSSISLAREVAMEQLKHVGLDYKAEALAGGLPIGERKKLEVARVLATAPELILLDEVMGGLNPAERDEMIKLILYIKTKGITQVVIEHDMKAIMKISDRIFVLNSGEKLAEGTPHEVVSNPQVVAAYLGESYAKGQ